MTLSPNVLLRRIGLVLLVSLLMQACGCGNSGPMAAAVDGEMARTTLKATLDAWKAGKLPADLRSGSPVIVVQDVDWQNGLKLQEYEMVGAGDKRDANLECPTELTLIDSEGATVTKTVTYIVGTDPVLTVFRKVNM